MTVAELKPGVVPAMFKDPHADDLTQPFWTAALQGKLICACCPQCGTYVMPPQPYCFQCQHHGLEWRELPGTGTVYSYTIVTHGLNPAFKQIVPFVSGVIELDGTQGAGARMLLNITDCDPAAIRVGTRVRVYFDRVSETYAMPRCSPIGDERKG